MHGSVIHRILPNQAIEEISREAFYKEISVKPKPRLLLAAPFLNTFVHETIPLSNRELEKADTRILPFSISDREHRVVTSLKLNDKKAVTIHAHLSLQGKLLLDEFKKQKVNVSWEPAVTVTIKNLLATYKAQTNPFSILRCYFHGEMLQIEWQGKILKFSHIPYWQQQASFHGKKQLVHQMLQETIHSQKVSTINLDCQSPISEKTNFISPGQLFTLESYKSRVKSNQRSFRKDPINPLRHLTRNRVLAAILAISIIWTGLLYFQISKRKISHQQLKTEVRLLEHNTEKLSEIAKVERKYFKFASLLDAIEITRFLPNDLFKVIESTLPSSTWIFKINATPQIIYLELLDQKSIELSKLIEGFNQSLGKTSLEVNEKIELQKKPLNKYTIKIQQYSQVTRR